MRLLYAREGEVKRKRRVRRKWRILSPARAPSVLRMNAAVQEKDETCICVCEKEGKRYESLYRMTLFREIRLRKVSRRDASLRWNVKMKMSSSDCEKRFEYLSKCIFFLFFFFFFFFFRAFERFFMRRGIV